MKASNKRMDRVKKILKSEWKPIGCSKIHVKRYPTDLQGPWDDLNRNELAIAINENAIKNHATRHDYLLEKFKYIMIATSEKHCDMRVLPYSWMINEFIPVLLWYLIGESQSSCLDVFDESYSYEIFNVDAPNWEDGYDITSDVVSMRKVKKLVDKIRYDVPEEYNKELLGLLKRLTSISRLTIRENVTCLWGI